MNRLAGAIGALALGCAPPAEPPFEPAERSKELLSAPHFAGDRFFNPWGAGDRSLLRGLRWQLTRSAYDKSGDPNVPVVSNDGAYLSDGSTSAPSVTWVGHATFAVHDGGDVFLTDPHWSERALVPRRVVPPGIPVESIPADAFAVISHSHYDHLDAETVEMLPASVGWIVPLGLADWFRNRGRQDVVELDWWQSTKRGRFEITCLPSQHWSLRIEHHENETLWCSWLIDSGERRYYFAGDTGYFHGFEEFGRRFPGIDVAMLPIGAYAPRWFMRYQHMDPADAYQAFRDLGARHMLAMHWGTFDLTDEPVDRPPEELAEVLAKRGGDARVAVLAVGERWSLPPAR